MKMTGMETDREKEPLMKVLHEIGLKHGVTMVVVAIPIAKDSSDSVRTLLIDHKECTPVADMISHFTGAGVYLIKVAAAAEEYVMEQAEMASKTANTSAHACEEECCLPK